MKKLLGIVVLSLILSWSTSIAATRDYKKIYKAELDKCIKDGKWVCEKSKIDEILTNYYNHGGQLKDCSLTSYKAPCRCDWEESAIKKKYCEIKMKPIKPKKIKRSRMEAAEYCSVLSNQKNKEIRNEYFKTCMKDQGFR